MQTTFFASLRKAKSPLVGFLCMVLMINIGAPIAVAASDPLASIDQTSLVAKYGPGTLLCTKRGYQWVSFAELGVDESRFKQGGQGSHCVFCLNLGDDFDQSGDSYAPSPFFLEQQPHFSRHYRSALVSADGDFHRARAPPFILA